MVRPLSLEKHRNYWEEKVHVVIDRKKESPVYVLKAEDRSGIERILHLNLLLPCDLLPFEGTLSSDKRKEKSNQVLIVRRRTLLVVKLQTVIHPVTTMYTEWYLMK